MEPIISADEFLRDFWQRGPKEVTYVDLGGEHPLPARSKAVSGAKTLTVLFHGAVDREKRKYPAFQWYLPGLNSFSHQISLADPTLAISEEISNGWFIGSPGTPLQKILPDFFRNIKRALGVEQIVFVGGSGGGFGALYYSWASPGSTAVVTVPQTNVWSYLALHRNRFIKHVWGNLDEHSPTVPCLDLKEVYGQGMENTVVYVQSTLDHFHVDTQMIPFLAALRSEDWRRIAVQCSYWGTPGHSGAVPNEERDRWVRAAIAAGEGADTEAIVESYYMSRSDPQQGGDASGRSSTSSNGSNGKAPGDRDIALTDRLAREMLAQGGDHHG